MLISEIVNLTDLVTRATDLLLRLPDNWYKGTSEIESFKSNLSILRQRTTLWKKQLNQFGMSEDPALKDLLVHAAKLLEKEDDYYEEHRKSCLWKVKRRLFPGKLTYILVEVLKVVEAGPGLLAEGVKTHELLTKSLSTIPSPLPFGYDRKYVPLPGAVAEVQRALDDREGPRVVTLSGEPGIGKSSLAKYVALLYQDSIRGSGPPPFDGVQYLFCGQESCKRMHQLQKEFLSDRGVALPVTEPAAIAGQGDQQIFQSTLRRLLVNQKLLIILDDVWKEDFEVLVNLICPGNRIKYLVTSQTRRIWPDALNIEVSKPDDEQALQILINQTEVLSVHRQTQSLCENLKTEIRDIAKKVENHPLSLVNVAVSMNRHGATDPNRWKVLAQNMYTHLDQNRYTGSILMYERPYSLSVSTSMMLMVESLRATERDLLFLVAMLQARYRIPEAMIRYFFRRLYHTDAPELSYNYVSGVDYLEDNSLVQFQRDGSGLTLGDSVEIKRACIKIHNLRRQYIRQKRLPELHSIASTILATQGDRDRCLVNVNVGDRDQCLATVFSTLYFDDFLIDEVALPFQSVMRQMSGGVIPRGLTQQIDAHELVRNAKNRWWKFEEMMTVAVELLNLQGDEGWKQKARTDTSKVMMKLVCQQELEDESMAFLLRMPQTTAVACQIFDSIYEYIYHPKLQHLFYFGQRRSLSETHPQTWTALSDLAYKNSWYETFWHLESSELPSRILKWMLEFEPERTVLAEVQKLRQFADQSPDPLLRATVEDGFLRLHESRLSSQMLSGGDLEYLPTILWKLISDDKLFVSSKLKRMYQQAVEYVFRDKGYVQTLFTLSISCDRWFTDSSLFRRLLKAEQRCRPWREWGLLDLLSGLPDFGTKIVEILRENCWEEELMRWPESYDGRLARFWGNVALMRDVHKTTIQKLVEIAQRWITKLTKDGTSTCFYACSYSNDDCGCLPECMACGPVSFHLRYWSVVEVMRAVTIIHYIHANSSIIIPSLNDSRDDCRAHMGQAQAYEEMRMYAKAILWLDRAQQTFDRISTPSPEPRYTWVYKTLKEEWRSQMIFVKAMCKDYSGSIDLVNQNLNDDATSTGDRPVLQLGNRAVLLRLAEFFSEAIDDFDQSLEICERRSSEHRYVAGDPRVHCFVKYCLLRHRGYAKRLMGNHEGSRRDAKSAQELKENNLIMEPVSWECFLRFSIGYDFKYSLLQLPINDNDFIS